VTPSAAVVTSLWHPLIPSLRRSVGNSPAPGYSYHRRQPREKFPRRISLRTLGRPCPVRRCITTHKRWYRAPFEPKRVISRSFGQGAQPTAADLGGKSIDEEAVNFVGTPLHHVALCGFPLIVKFMIIGHSQGVRPWNCDRLMTSLHMASSKGHVEVACILFKHVADATTQDQVRSTPPHLASTKKLAVMLLEGGASATAQG